VLLIWRGRGPLVLLIGAAAIFLAVILGEALKIGVDGETVLAGIAMVPAGLAIWFLGQRWDGPGRELVDAATGERVVLKRGDSLFFIPFRWWGPIVAILGVVVAASGLAGPK
jgi:hypothetical protein